MIITQFDNVFYKWGLLFAQSLYFTNPNEKLYMDAVNLDKNQIKSIRAISPLITIANRQIQFPQGIHVPTFMANRKVLVFLDILKKKLDDKYILIDTDMLFRKPLSDLYGKLMGVDAAIIFRNGFWDGRIWEHLKVACGLVVINNNGIPLIEKWNEIMNDNNPIYGYAPWQWYWDQIALLEATRKIPSLKYASIDPDFYINRDFGQEAYIWSANKAPKDYMYEMFCNEFEKMRGNHAV